jgi:hypothetical protein
MRHVRYARKGASLGATEVLEARDQMHLRTRENHKTVDEGELADVVPLKLETKKIESHARVGIVGVGVRDLRKGGLRLSCIASFGVVSQA